MRVIVVTLLAGLAVVAAAVAGAVHAGSLIGTPSGRSDSVSIDQRPGRVLWDGGVFPINVGRYSVVLDRITLSGRRGVRAIATYTHRPKRLATAIGRTWPPPTNTRPLRRLRGTVVPSHREIQIVVKLVAPPAPGRFGYRAVVIHYHRGPFHYRALARHGLTVCVTARPVRCD